MLLLSLRPTVANHCCFSCDADRAHADRADSRPVAKQVRELQREGSRLKQRCLKGIKQCQTTSAPFTCFGCFPPLLPISTLDISTSPLLFVLGLSFSASSSFSFFFSHTHTPSFLASLLSPCLNPRQPPLTVASRSPYCLTLAAPPLLPRPRCAILVAPPSLFHTRGLIPAALPSLHHLLAPTCHLHTHHTACSDQPPLQVLLCVAATLPKTSGTTVQPPVLTSAHSNQNSSMGIARAAKSRRRHGNGQIGHALVIFYGINIARSHLTCTLSLVVRPSLRSV